MHSRRLLAVVVVTVAASTFVACGSDSSSETDVGSSAPTIATQPSEVSSPSAPSAASAGPTTGADMCSRLDVAAVAAALGLDVTDAVPDDSSTPQCAYGYESPTGATSNLTVAYMRPEDVGGMAGQDAFDFTVGINRSFADGDEAEVDAGDAAIRLSGTALHVGVLLVGDNVYTLIVPADDASPTGVEQLLSTMADTFG